MNIRIKISMLLVVAITSLMASSAWAEDRESASVAGQFRQVGNTLTLIEERPSETISLYHDRSLVTLPSHARWSYMCGSDTSDATIDDLQQMAEIARGSIAGFSSKSVVISEAGLPSSQGLNIIFESPCTLPAEVATALESVATYIESQFGDPIEVRILVDFVPLNPGIIGGTSSIFFSLTYPFVRDSLIATQDGNDFIQSFLPSGLGIPVRYTTNPVSTTENTIFITRANLSAGVGRIDGIAAIMQFSSAFSFDFDPSNGIGIGQIDFQSVVVHEVGHALGFTSAVDVGGFSMDLLDMFRFDLLDGAGDFNPDTTLEFRTRPRSVQAGVAAVSDVFATGVFNGEYRMEDAVSQQASHFLDNIHFLNNIGIGIMDPTFGTGESFFPNFFRVPDLAIFDAMGWDFPRITTPSGQPVGSCCSTSGCIDGLSESACVDNISLLVDCFGGPHITTPPAGCSASKFMRADLDVDGDVDLEDISMYQNELGMTRGFNGVFIQGAACSSGFCACVTATNSCDVGDVNTVGCNSFECCQSVCALDSFCCTNAWDGGCALRANNQCSMNDDCADAAIIFDGITPFSNTFATSDGEPDCLSGDCFVGTNDIWFDYQATCTGTLTVSTCNSLFDTTVQIYQGTSCPPTIQRVCADDDTGCPKCSISFTDCNPSIPSSCSPAQGTCQTFGIPSSAITNVSLGVNYRIRVGGWGGAFGSGEISIVCN